MIESIFEALNAAGVRYVLVGGLATVLQGFPRLTTDVDLIIDLEATEARKVIEVLLALGLHPRAPVDARLFADPQVRQEWITEKGLQVFSMADPRNPLRVVDLFVESPIPFAELWARSVIMPLTRTGVRVAAIPDLIRLKRIAGRPQDLMDIEALEAIAKRQELRDE